MPRAIERVIYHFTSHTKNRTNFHLDLFILKFPRKRKERQERKGKMKGKIKGKIKGKKKGRKKTKRASCIHCSRTPYNDLISGHVLQGPARQTQQHTHLYNGYRFKKKRKKCELIRIGESSFHTTFLEQ